MCIGRFLFDVHRRFSRRLNSSKRLCRHSCLQAKARTKDATPRLHFEEKEVALDALLVVWIDGLAFEVRDFSNKDTVFVVEGSGSASIENGGDGFPLVFFVVVPFS